MRKKWKLLLATTAAVVIVASITGIAVAGGPAWKTTATTDTTVTTAATSSSVTPDTEAESAIRRAGQGYGQRAGVGYAGSNSATVATSLSDAEEADILFMREEEKLARDVYISLYERWGVSEFDTIATSESRHMASIEKLLDRYGLVDPVTTDVRGEFANPELDTAYDQLLAQGLQSVEEAYKVGVAIEQLDIDDLERVIDEATHGDITRVMQNLLRGSENHLRAFSGLAG
jgi:hypothetical protein